VKLKDLGILQASIKEIQKEIHDSLVEISQIINICCSYFTSENLLKNYQIPSSEHATISWWDSLYQGLEDKTIPWQYIETQVKDIEVKDNEIEQSENKRTKHISQLKLYRELAAIILRIQTRKETSLKTIKISQGAIDKFDTDNAKLIEYVEIEKEIVIQNNIISDAYNSFVQLLNNYKNELPNHLVADLGELIVILYNAFNRNDAHHEQFANVKLPLNKNEHLEIAFQNAPDVFYDALHILSEGHIRCIGLAILAAKNIKENCPLFIFDDPVNAIDDDHRESIRKTLFESPFFQDKQIILACHGEEFFKDIQNLLSAEEVNQSRTLSFLPKLDDYHIQVDRHCSPRNYILSSRLHFGKNEIRNSLSESRRALEVITKGAIWTYVNRYGDGNLSIKMRSAKSPIELRNLTEQLKTKISKGDFSDPNKDSILQPLDSLLGISGESREWRYLNKGTHDETDRAEFDRGTVNQIITSLEQIDSVLSMT